MNHNILIIGFDSLLDFLLKLNVHNGIPVSDFLYKLCIRGEWHERDLEWLKNILENGRKVERYKQKPFYERYRFRTKKSETFL